MDGMSEESSTRGSALDVEELLHADVCAETCLRYCGFNMILLLYFVKKTIITIITYLSIDFSYSSLSSSSHPSSSL